MSSDVDKFIQVSKQWREEIECLRAIILSSNLAEGFKWKKPCYSYEASNVAIIQPFKSCLGLMFFKGTLLKDPKGILIDNGPNSQAGRRIEFTSVQEVSKLKSTISAYIKDAIELEKSGQNVEFKQRPEAIPDELTEAFRKMPKLKKAFDSLTPGRQRAYILYFLGAKQSLTRVSRIEKCIARILEGKGMNDI